MKTFKQFLTEAKARNAWSGKMKHIENLLAWMYDKKYFNKNRES